MEMNERAELARGLKSQMNCMQAVMIAYKDEMGIPEDAIMKLGAGFGLGMGGMESTCGALEGAAAVVGFIDKSAVQPKMVAKRILENFEGKCGATLCKDLKGAETGQMLCSCPDCVKNAVLALEEEVER